jgi:uncharacterized lipoprotein YehR (DUF1307 family)
MNKKILSVLFVLMIIASLCGCSQKSNEAETSTSNQSEATTSATVDFTDDLAKSTAINYTNAIVNNDENAVEDLIPAYYNQIYEASNLTVAEYAKTCLSQSLDMLPDEAYTLEAEVDYTATADQITRYIFGIDLPEGASANITQIKLVSVYAVVGSGDNAKKINVYNKLPVVVCNGAVGVDFGMIDEASQYIN